jgi:predicted transcriptional regulator
MLRELKRNQYDIAAEIIQLAKDDRGRKTEIMYGANMSYEQLQVYLNRMISGGLLVLEGKKYVPTQDAKTWLEKYREMRQITPMSLSPEE